MTDHKKQPASKKQPTHAQDHKVKRGPLNEGHTRITATVPDPKNPPSKKK